MTFAPVLPLAALAVIALALIVIRLLTMRQLHATSGGRWATVWRWCGLTLAVLLIVIAAARPGLPGADGEATTAAPSARNVNVFFVVDRSSDVAAIRPDIVAAMQHYPQARFALITFAARPALEWPLSEDAWSLQPVIASLVADPGAEPEVDAAAAANTLRYQLISSGQQYRDAENLVFYFGSGARGSEAIQGEFDPVAGTVDGGAVFGYGTADEPALQRVADQLGVPYHGRDVGTSLPLPSATPEAQTFGAPTSVPARTELYWVFTMLAALLLTVELFLTLLEYRRTRRGVLR